jgi:hypothetical protein
MRVLEREPGGLQGGSVIRAVRMVTLSLIIAVFASFAAHHAESIFLSTSHASTVAPHVETALDMDAATAAISPTAPAVSASDTDVLALAGLGCAAIILCGLLGALVKTSAVVARHPLFLGGRTERVVAVFANVISRIPTAPSSAELSISRT